MISAGCSSSDQKLDGYSTGSEINQQSTIETVNTDTTDDTVTTETKVDSTNDVLSNDNYYTNYDGEEIHSPAYEDQQDTVPDGASAKCGDGTYSFSTHHQGTCSHHDGVDEWIN